MHLDLLADIGGTNARVAFRHDRKPEYDVHRRRSADYPDLEALLSEVIAAAGWAPTRAAIALAGPVEGEGVRLTNLPWRVTRSSLAATLQVPTVLLVNDVEATVRSLPHLRDGDVQSLRAGRPARAAQFVVSAGTGLGVSALAPATRGWTAVPSEGGHAGAVMPRSTPEDLRVLWRGNPSWEDLLSGAGLLRIYRALGGAAESPSAVTAGARNDDALACRAVSFFSELLGACAGDMALIFAGRGGCFLAGGVVGALGRQFDRSRFIAGFLDKGTYTPYVAEIPIGLIVHPDPALLGLAALLDASDPGAGP